MNNKYVFLVALLVSIGIVTCIDTKQHIIPTVNDTTVEYVRVALEDEIKHLLDQYMKSIRIHYNKILLVTDDTVNRKIASWKRDLLRYLVIHNNQFTS